MKRILQLGLVALTPCVLALVSSCGSAEVTCNDNRTCTKDNGGTGGGGNANAGGGSGLPGAGGSSGANGGASSGGTSGGGTSSGGSSAGNGGTRDGEAGAGGAAGAPPCNGACVGATPVCKEVTNTCVECADNSTCASPKAACDTATNSCVECTDKSTCPAPKPACDTMTTVCVECTAATDCKDVTKPFCATTADQCVACLKQADCTTAIASACNAGACTACTKDSECSNIAGKGVCDAGACVQCTGTKFAACGQSAGTPLVCDSLKRTCSANKQASAGLCQSCVSDEQCTAGKMCVQEQFGTPAQSVGYFCFWKKGDTADGAPTTCLPGADPYAATLANATSIDGTKSDICSLRSSTCIAKSQFSSKDCKNVSLPDDSLCGFAPAKDSKCAQADVGVFRCTMTCGSDDDCPSPFTCNTGATPQVCNLQ